MEYILSKMASKESSTLLSSGEFILPIFWRVMLLFSKMIVKMQSLKVLQRIWIKICAEACSVWLWEFFRCTCWQMSAARVKTIPFCKLLVKWIDNGTTYFNSITLTQREEEFYGRKRIFTSQILHGCMTHPAWKL